jgi:hypothetical protein
MLFYAHNKKLGKIPNSFVKISISNIINMANIDNGMDLKILLPPPMQGGGNKSFLKRIDMKFDKDEYKDYLKKPSSMKYIVLICSLLDSSLNAVLINYHKENQKYLKEICKFIKKKYNYPFYKFKSMDDITLDMRKESMFDDDSRIQVQEDIKKYMNE